MADRKKKNSAGDGTLILATLAAGLAAGDGGVIDEAALFERVAAIIENRKSRAYARVNTENTMMFWEIGEYINSVVLDSKRADYGKKILPSLAVKLELKYGNNFNAKNLYRMMLFAERFANAEILPPLAAKLSWSHFIELLPLKSDEARLFYANDAVVRNYGTKELRRQISRKAYERREIANTALSGESVIPFNVLKDPYYHIINKIRINREIQCRTSLL